MTCAFSWRHCWAAASHRSGHPGGARLLPHFGLHRGRGLVQQADEVPPLAVVVAAALVRRGAHAAVRVRGGPVVAHALEADVESEEAILSGTRGQ